MEVPASSSLLKFHVLFEIFNMVDATYVLYTLSRRIYKMKNMRVIAKSKMRKMKTKNRSKDKHRKLKRRGEKANCYPQLYLRECCPLLKMKIIISYPRTNYRSSEQAPAADSNFTHIPMLKAFTKETEDNVQRRLSLIILLGYLRKFNPSHKNKSN